jgi:hypothetical protein
MKRFGSLLFGIGLLGAFTVAWLLSRTDEPRVVAAYHVLLGGASAHPRGDRSPVFCGGAS